ncbi:MAG: T9SS type A sorting domain-containing protein [Bacteroidetes bacterium]|nr:T9SS type A sorting domain-containing protein [Bacteroidota bacterium]
MMQITLHGQVIVKQECIGGTGQESKPSMVLLPYESKLVGSSTNSGIGGDKSQNSRGGYDYWIIMLDSNNVKIWDKGYGGSADDILIEVISVSGGGFLLAGHSKSDSSFDKNEHNYGSINSNDFWIIRIDDAGNILWQKTIGGSSNEELANVIQTSDGGFLIGGISDSPISGLKTEANIGWFDLWLVKLDANGNLIWENTIGGSGNELCAKMHQLPNGNIIIASSSTSGVSGDKTSTNKGSYDFWLLQIDNGGNILSQFSIGGNSSDYCKKAAPSTDGSIIVAGYSASGAGFDKTHASKGANDYWIMKTDTMLNIIWQKTIGGNADDNLVDFSEKINNEIVLLGSSFSNVGGDKKKNCRGFSDFWIVGLDASGNINYENTIGGTQADIPTAISCFGKYQMMFVGQSASNAGFEKKCVSSNTDIWLCNASDKYYTFRGNLFYDLNQDGIKNGNDVFAANRNVFLSDYSQFVLTNSIGNYEITVIDSGQYILKPEIVNLWTSHPDSISISTDSNRIYNLSPFYYDTDTQLIDLRITITPTSAFRPGFDASYTITYENIGNTAIAPTIIFYPHNSVTFLAASQTPSSIYSDSVIWSLGILPVFGKGTISISVNVGLVQIGSLLNSSCKIDPMSQDYFTSNNTHAWEVIVTGSYDPNDISVNIDTIFTTQLNDPPFLYYHINFQNTGNDTAFNIRVVNPIDTAILDLTSFELIANSHPIDATFKASTQFMEFQFDNILLPDSNIDEQNSHGYVTYRIKPKESTKDGSIIHSVASIYFDFNAAVVTNTATTYFKMPENFFGTNISGAINVCLDTSLIFNYKTDANAGSLYQWIIPDAFIIGDSTLNNIDIKWQSAGLKQMILIECDSNNFVCDTDMILVNVYPTQLLITNSVICNGDSVLLGTSWQSQAGIYYDTLATYYGCDSILKNILAVNQTFNSILSYNLCMGDSIYAGGQWQITNGTYFDNYTSQNGCDSLVTTNVLFHPTYMVYDTLQIAVGDSVFLFGNWQSTTGVYSGNLVSVYGCDSIMNTYLSVVTALTNTIKRFDFKIFPNPVTDELCIQFNMISMPLSRATIYTESGVQVSSFAFDKELICYDTSVLQSGNYLVEIKNGNRKMIKKFIKK